MAAEVKARITVDAAEAYKRIEEINKASGYASASMSKMAREVGEANKALSSLGAGMGGTSNGTAFKNITDQLEKQALAYTLVDSKAKAAAESATLYRNAIISLTKSGSLTKEQTDELVRTYNSYRTAAESAKVGTEKVVKAQVAMDRSMDGPLKKLVSIAGNILKLQLLMGPITAAIRGVKNAFSESLKAAAEAEQVFNKLNTVFAGLEKSATGAANAIASTLGVATSTAAGALSTVGDLLQAQGMGTADSLSTATSWVSRFYDIINFKDINMSLEEFAQNFMSGAAGNLRNFRTFGSIVKESAVNARLAAQGLDKLTGSQLELAKMTARAEMALEQQANAMGATEREWDTMLSVNRRLNEAWKETAERIGSSWNNVFKFLKSGWTQVLEATNDAARAAEEYAEKGYTTSVYDTENDNLDRKLYRNALIPIISQNFDAIRMYSDAEGAVNSDATMFALLQIEHQMALFGASVETTRELLGDRIPEAVYNYLSIEEKAIEAKEKEAKAYADAAALILSQGQSIDAFTESLASLFGVNARSTNLAAVGEGVNEYNYEDLLQSFGLTAANQMNTVMSSVIRQVAGLGPDAFFTDIEQAFGTGDTQAAYKSWLDEIVSLYTILYNREVEFGDVGRDVLDDVIDMWGMVNEELQDYIKGIEEANRRDQALAEAQSSAASYRAGLDNYGLSDFAVKRNELQGRIDNAQSGAEANLWSDALRDFITVTVKNLEGSFSGLAYEAELATVGMTDNEKALYELERKYNETLTALEETGESSKTLTENYESQRKALIALQKAERDAAKAAAELAAWVRTGDRALNSTGTLGGVIDSFRGEGDIWSKLINAVLTILENTESWGEIAAMLDQMFEMFEPVVEALLDVIVALSPVWEVIIFCLKVIASVIVAISAGITMILNTFKWLWENIKVAFHNLGQIIAHPVNAGKRDMWGWANLSEMQTEAQEKANEYLAKIWSSTSTIERNTAKGDDYAKQLALLKSLYDGGVLNVSEYEGSVGRLVGSPMGRIESYSGHSYAAGPGGGVTYYTGSRSYTINFTGTGYTRDDARELVRQIALVESEGTWG